MKSPRFRGIFPRTLLSAMLVAAMPLVVFATITITNFEEEQKNTIINNLAQIANKKSDEIYAFFEERTQDMTVMSGDPVVKGALEKIARAYRLCGLDSPEYNRTAAEYSGFFEHFRNITGIYDFFLISSDGEVVYTLKKEPDLGTNLVHGKYNGSQLASVFNHSKYFLEASVSEFRYYEPSVDDAAFVAAPILDHGRFVGSVAVQLNKDRVISVISDVTGLGRTGETMVGRLEGDEIILMFDGIGGGRASKPKIKLGSTNPSPIMRAVKGERGRGVGPDYRGREVVAAWSYLPEMRWGMVVKIESSEAFAGVRRARNYAITAVAVIIGLALLASAYLARSIARPITNLTKFTRSIFQGDYSVRATKEFDDEVGELAESFNAMTEKVEGTLASLRKAEKELLASHAQLETRVEERTTELKEANKLLNAEIREHTAAENKLRLAAKVIENTSEAVVITDLSGTILDVNRAYTEQTGFTREEAIGENPRIGKSGRHDKNFYKKMWHDILTKGQWSGEIWDRRKDGTIYPKWLFINSVRDDVAKTTRFVALFSDMTKIKKTEEDLQRLAYYDSLTGLPNRAFFRERLVQEIASSNRHGLKTAIMFIDLDRFKYVNDTLGHTAGDALLQVMGERFKGCVRGTDTVARLGGDEFTIIITEVAHIERLADVAQTLLKSFDRPVLLGGRDVYVNGAIGISVYPDDGKDAETIIKNADKAMYLAKERGGGTFHFFTKEMDAQGASRLEMEADIRGAIERNEFTIHYQPLVDLRTGALSGMEALIRWPHAEKGMVMPDKFIPLAEETGLIIPIEDLVMNEVCRQIARWRKEGYRPVPVSINLSAPQFRQKNLVKKISGVIDANGIEPSLIEFELIERTLMDDAEAGLAVLDMFDEMGIRVNIDDFGTGYSSLSYLNMFKVYKLKIDKSFVNGLPGDHKSSAITRSIINMAKNLGIRTVAEGVETEEQRAFLIREGCDDMQGYLFSKPVPAEAVSRFLKKIV